MKRRHRWIRGDWQIASWMLPWVPGPSRKIQEKSYFRIIKMENI